jgi:hypothetical protein
MKQIIIAIAAIGLILVGAWQVYHFMDQFQGSHPAAPATAPATVAAPEPAAGPLPGLPPKLEPALEAARQRGAAGLRDFLAANGKNVADPRLASIQLDYVLVAAPGDPAEARKVFAQVKARLTPGSPVYARMKQLEKTYE